MCSMEQKKLVFNQQNVGEEENNYISNSYSLLEQARKTENSFQSMCTIQSSTSAAESSLDVGLFIELDVFTCANIFRLLVLPI